MQRLIGTQAIGNALAQIAAGQVLHGDVGTILGKALLINLRNVWMTYLSNQCIFLQEPLQHVLIGIDRDHLEHPGLTGFVMTRQIDL